MPRYWGYRIDTNSIGYFKEELDQNRLRQGWGHDEGQDLRNMTVDDGASRNRRMLEVRKGDVLLVPRLPDWDKVAIVEATEDWGDGYRFEIDSAQGDYGHIFPAKSLKHFVRNAALVPGGIRTTLRNPMRFWNIDYLAKDIDELRNARQEELDHGITLEDRLRKSMREALRDTGFTQDGFMRLLREKVNKEFEGKSWEEILRIVLEHRYPGCQVEVVGGRTEDRHGTDVLIRIPGIVLSEYEYAIAVQVKDHKESINWSKIIDQINRADAHWERDGLRVIEKVIAIPEVRESDIENWKDFPSDADVKRISADQIDGFLIEYALEKLGIETL